MEINKYKAPQINECIHKIYVIKPKEYIRPIPGYFGQIRYVDEIIKIENSVFVSTKDKIFLRSFNVTKILILNKKAWA